MFERKFMLRGIFRNFRESFSETLTRESDVEEHFGVGWYIQLAKIEKRYDILLRCTGPVNRTSSSWTIKMNFDLEFPCDRKRELNTRKKCQGSLKEDCDYVFGSSYFLSTIVSSIAEDTFIIDWKVNILKTEGIPAVRNMSFSKKKDNTDVIVKAGNEKFHLSKTMLCHFSDYFKLMVFGPDPNKSETELKDCNADVFHTVLEVIHGQPVINDDNVIDVLKLAAFCQMKVVLDECEKCLMASKQVEKKELLRLADEFNLDELKRKCFHDINFLIDFKEYMPDDPFKLQQATLAMFTTRALSLIK